MKNQDMMKTGTTTMGIICKDGVVLAADKRATAGNMICSGYIEKIVQISDDMAVTIAGTVSDAQLTIKLIKAETALKTIRTGQTITVSETANLLAQMLYNNVRRMSMIPGITHFLLSGRDKEGIHLYDIFVDGSLTKIRDFTSTGSGSVFAYGVLETLYEKSMTVEEGVKLALKSVNAALQRDSASGNGIDIVTITNKGVKKVLEKEIKTRIEV